MSAPRYNSFIFQGLIDFMGRSVSNLYYMYPTCILRYDLHVLGINAVKGPSLYGRKTLYVHYKHVEDIHMYTNMEIICLLSYLFALEISPQLNISPPYPIQCTLALGRKIDSNLYFWLFTGIFSLLPHF